MREFPPRLIFTDVETTGLYGYDRVVSIGLVTLDFGPFGPEHATCEHLLFNPGRKCSKRAREVHGYSDEVLAKMPPFSKYATYLLPAFEDPSVVWAHNAEFDEAFIRREFASAGIKLPRRKMKCTKELWWKKRSGPGALDKICAEIGIPTSARHSALLDAWRCMLVWCHLNDVSASMFPAEPPRAWKPTNLMAA